MAILNLSRDVQFNDYLARELRGFQAGLSGRIDSYIEYSEGLKQLQTNHSFYSVIAIDVESAEDQYGLDALELAWKITSAPTFKLRPKFLIHSKMSLTHEMEAKLLNVYARRLRFLSRLAYPAAISTVLNLAEDFQHEFDYLTKQRIYLWHRHWLNRDFCRAGETFAKISFDLENPETFIPLSIKEGLIIQKLVLIHRPTNQSVLRGMVNGDDFFKKHSQNAPVEEAYLTKAIPRATFNAELDTAEDKLRKIYEQMNGEGSFSLIWNKYRHGQEVRLLFDVWPEIVHMD
jgi:hypothetical protein